ncbi:hypothetical protein [Cyanobium gracile]|uniref:Uncharacterized protein n=1 Tax=Cyanobium gracile UHCC 0281 TaxID=3110309 RepID=A0ABU5ST94_9CYAN|nr:hypothetical protein [Cyanobium gracile]MEA5441587.1 hypothetical protein [Cyanobium gracile UHCC 0281]
MTTQQHIVSRSSQEMANVDERLRQAILDKRQAQIQELSDKIDQLQNQAKQVAEGVRDETQSKLKELRAARDAATSRLQELQRSSQDAWSGLLEQTDEAFQSMSDRFHAFVNSQS